MRLSSSSVRTRSRGVSSIALLDRKSTRLNSSHSQISYAVFCLKKKKKETNALSLGRMAEDDIIERLIISLVLVGWSADVLLVLALVDPTTCQCRLCVCTTDLS